MPPLRPIRDPAGSPDVLIVTADTAAHPGGASIARVYSFSAYPDTWALARAMAAAGEAREEVRREALEEAAQIIEPKNPIHDWTEYARICADNAAAIRALASMKETT